MAELRIRFKIHKKDLIEQMMEDISELVELVDDAYDEGYSDRLNGLDNDFGQTVVKKKVLEINEKYNRENLTSEVIGVEESDGE